MEDILDSYQRPYDPLQPLVCMDEMSKPLIDETRVPLPVMPGQPEKYDYEYERKGVNNVFMVFEPLMGERHVSVTDRRTRVDWAKCIKEIVDTHYPEAAKITVIMDNLNTHRPSSLYQAFSPEEARRLLNKLEFHYTPKHGSWLNMAEIEFSVLKRQCLDCRIPDQATLKQKVTEWEQARNVRAVKANWQFKTEDARIKLRRLYPSFSD
jgi:transposase